VKAYIIKQNGKFSWKFNIVEWEGDIGRTHVRKIEEGQIKWWHGSAREEVTDSERIERLERLVKHLL